MTDSLESGNFKHHLSVYTYSLFLVWGFRRENRGEQSALQETLAIFSLLESSQCGVPRTGSPWALRQRQGTERGVHLLSWVVAGRRFGHTSEPQN